MRTYYKISKPGCESTRLSLSRSQWAQAVLKRLSEMGYLVEVTGQPDEPDLRDAAEYERAMAILDAADPYPNGMTLADAQALHAAQSDSGS